MELVSASLGSLRRAWEVLEDPSGTLGAPLGVPLWVLGSIGGVSGGDGMNRKHRKCLPSGMVLGSDPGCVNVDIRKS